jgi:hypothetical protein
MKWFAQFRPFLRYAKLKFELDQNGFEITPEIVRNVKEHSYRDQWLICRENRWFHLYMDDNCFFNFAINPKPSYTFFDCPLQAVSLSAFREEFGLYDHGVHRSILEAEYQDYLATCPFRSSVTPIRYDHDPSSYRPGVHPTAHIHIGLENEIRLGVKRELTPLAFLLFVVRQKYPHNWEYLLQSNLVDRIERIVRDELTEIVAPLMTDMDRLELYLN